MSTTFQFIYVPVLPLVRLHFPTAAFLPPLHGRGGSPLYRRQVQHYCDSQAGQDKPSYMLQTPASIYLTNTGEFEVFDETRSFNIQAVRAQVQINTPNSAGFIQCVPSQITWTGGTEPFFLIGCSNSPGHHPVWQYIVTTFHTFLSPSESAYLASSSCLNGRPSASHTSTSATRSTTGHTNGSTTQRSTLGPSTTSAMNTNTAATSSTGGGTTSVSTPVPTWAPSAGKSRLSTGAISGMAAGIGSVSVLLAIASFLYIKERRKNRGLAVRADLLTGTSPLSNDREDRSGRGLDDDVELQTNGPDMVQTSSIDSTAQDRAEQSPPHFHGENIRGGVTEEKRLMELTRLRAARNRAVTTSGGRDVSTTPNSQTRALQKFPRNQFPLAMGSNATGIHDTKLMEG
ncbi:hypothetical protein V8D89_000449 [Ganoderma adspersum]